MYWATLPWPSFPRKHNRMWPLRGRNCVFKCWQRSFKAVPCLKLLVAGHSPRNPGFDLRPVHVRFVVENVTVGQVSFQDLRISPVTVIHQWSIHTSSQKDKWAKHENLPNNNDLTKSGSLDRKLLWRRSSKGCRTNYTLTVISLLSKEVWFRVGYPDQFGCGNFHTVAVTDIRSQIHGLSYSLSHA